MNPRFDRVRSDTSLQVDMAEVPGHRPQLRVRMFVKGTDEVIGEATFYAETAARFVLLMLALPIPSAVPA